MPSLSGTADAKSVRTVGVRGRRFIRRILQMECSVMSRDLRFVSLHPYSVALLPPPPVHFPLPFCLITTQSWFWLHHSSLHFLSGASASYPFFITFSHDFIALPTLSIALPFSSKPSRVLLAQLPAAPHSFTITKLRMCPDHISTKKQPPPSNKRICLSCI